MTNLRKVAATLSLLATLSWLATATPAQDKRGPSTPEERKMAVQAARLLERDPFHEKAKDVRRWFTIWLIQVPDISVSVCTHYLGALYKSDKNYSSEITSQMMFSSAAFIIESPDKAKDSVAANLAGLEGALKSYEAILKLSRKRNRLSSMICSTKKRRVSWWSTCVRSTKPNVKVDSSPTNGLNRTRIKHAFNRRRAQLLKD